MIIRGKSPQVTHSFPDLDNVKDILDMGHGQSSTRIEFWLVPIILLWLEYQLIYSVYLQDTHYNKYTV